MPHVYQIRLKTYTSLTELCYTIQINYHPTILLPSQIPIIRNIYQVLTIFHTFFWDLYPCYIHSFNSPTILEIKIFIIPNLQKKVWNTEVTVCQISVTNRTKQEWKLNSLIQVSTYVNHDSAFLVLWHHDLQRL